MELGGKNGEWLEGRMVTALTFMVTELTRMVTAWLQFQGWLQHVHCTLIKFATLAAHRVQMSICPLSLSIIVIVSDPQISATKPLRASSIKSKVASYDM